MPATRALIKASHIIAYDGQRHRHLKDGVDVIEGVSSIPVDKTWPGAADQTIDATGRIVTPGMINTHTHLSESPLDRSLVEDTGKRNFYNSALFDMLPGRTGAEDEEMMKTCLDFSFAELLQTGTTTVVAATLVLRRRMLPSWSAFFAEGPVRRTLMNIGLWTALGLYAIRMDTRSMAGLKFRGSMMTCPISGMFWADSFRQNSALGSSGIVSFTAPPVISVAYGTVSAFSETM